MFVATLFLALLLCRFVSLVFKAVHETHCFLRDSTHSMRCSNFTLVSFPLQNTTGWLCVSVITSTICLLHYRPYLSSAGKDNREFPLRTLQWRGSGANPTTPLPAVSLYRLIVAYRKIYLLQHNTKQNKSN